MSKTIKIQLGGKAYELKPQNLKTAELWKQNHVTPLVRTLKKIDLSNLHKDGNLIHLVDISSQIADAVIDWSKELQADTDHLLSSTNNCEYFEPYMQIVTAWIIPLDQLDHLNPLIGGA